MLSLFNANKTFGQGIQIAQDWPYVKAGIEKELQKVILYMRNSSLATKSDHFLVRLIHNIAVPVGIDTERYYANVDAMALNLAMAIGMTSSISKGKIFENIFYGPNSKEVLIAVDTPFDFEHVHSNWENVRSVEVIRHDLSDLSLNIPDGKKNWDKDGFAVIMINIPMLAVQYRAFLLQEKYYYDLTGESPRSVMQFIARYVLPNMLRSHVDHVLINRFSNLLNNRPMTFPVHKLPFYITQYEQKLNRVQERYIKMFENSNKDIHTMMEQIPVVSKDNLRILSLLPEIASTMQVNWALLVARLPILQLMVDLSKSGLLKKSRVELNEIKRVIRSYQNSYLLENMLPDDLLINANNTINELKLMAET